MLLFDEPREVARIFCIFLIIAGAAGLRILAGR
jgi:quaternary ammonium compound-resistance protein SugE